MKLSAILFKVKFPKGHLFRGKYRLVEKVTPEKLAQLRNDYEIEEKNMLLLRHPYLTLEQSTGHMRALRPDNDFANKCYNGRIEKFTKTVTYEDHLMHLKVKDAWD